MPASRLSRPLSKPLNRFRARSLSQSATGLAAVAATSSLVSDAHATVISDLSTTHNLGDVFSLDGTVFGEIELISRGMGGMFDLFLDAPTVMMGNSSTVDFAFFSSGGMMPTEYLDALPLGTTVDGTLAYNGEGFLLENLNVNPEIAPGTTAYAGFVFDPTGTLPLYGWVRVNFDSSGTSFTVDQWAYDDTGATINVGSVPEPTASILIGLGLAGLALSARRFRTREIAEIASTPEKR